MKVSRELLMKALDVVKTGVANKELLAQITSYAFEDGAVRSYNDEICISYPIDIGITGAVRAAEFHSLISKVKAANLIIRMEEGLLVCQSKRGSTFKAGIKVDTNITLPSMNYEDIKWSKFRVPSYFLSLAAPYCSTDFSMPVLTCLHITQGRIEASDNYRLLQINDPTIKVKNSFLLPAKYVPNIILIDPVQYAVSDEWLHLKAENGSIFSCRIFSDDFPDTSNLSKQGKVINKFELDIAAIQSILEPAGVFSERDFSEDERIELVFSSGNLLLKSQSDIGWYQEEMKLPSYTGEEMHISLNPHIFEKIEAGSDGKIQCLLESGKIILSSSNWVLISAL